MKRFIFAFLLLGSGLVMGQTYVGSMTIGDYTRREVRVDLGHDYLLMRSVKFARMMPVKLDITFPQVRRDGKQLSGNNIVPTSEGKAYEKYRVRDLRGTVSDTLRFSCLMGKKELHYEGILQRRKK